MLEPLRYAFEFYFSRRLDADFSSRVEQREQAHHFVTIIYIDERSVRLRGCAGRLCFSQDGKQARFAQGLIAALQEEFRLLARNLVHPQHFRPDVRRTWER